jgi:hypothetical protein
MIESSLTGDSWHLRAERRIRLQGVGHLNPLNFLIVSPCRGLRISRFRDGWGKIDKAPGGEREEGLSVICDQFRIPAENAGDSPNHHGNGIAIHRLDGFVFLEASIRECTVSNLPPECPVLGIHSVNKPRPGRQRRLHPYPKLPVVRPVRFRHEHRRGANIEVHPTDKVDCRASRKSI